MSPPNREVAIFSAALELESSQRAAYLGKACADDPALRQRIEGLLADHDKALNFLETPPPGAEGLPPGAEPSIAPVGPSGSPTEKAGDRIGRYKLLQQIGEGGCGVVYMAEQEESVRRRVAVKVIKLGMDTRRVVARFEAERQALALMDHPNIAKVLDAGATETGRPYFVMELVRGIKITDYCDENGLSTRQRLDLFIQVCQAIQHAHQKGIIHRDIKPSNILVADHDGVPVPKVIDFGVAKATTDQRLTDKTLFTAFEQFIGTPAYMSPEQAKLSGLDIDTRTDIYSLGVLLYELLTGKTPLDQKELLAAGLDEMRRTIREKEPARPSTRLSTMVGDELTTTAKRRQSEPVKLIHQVRGDLDWIVMKCLEKDRARRYETANGLAMDVQRHLADEPVVARPPSGLYRFQKLVRRNKGVFAAVGAVALMLVLGVVGSTVEALRAGRAEQAQTRLASQADAQRQKAEAEAGLLRKMLLSVGPSVAKGRDTKMLEDILEEGLKSISKELTNQPEVEVELSLTLADTYYDLGLHKQMEGVARHSLQVARTRLGEENESVANSLITLGVSLLSTAQRHLGQMFAGNIPQTEKDRRLEDTTLREAEKCCLEGLAMHRKLLGEENLKVARALNLLGQIRLTQYNFAEAETLLRQALAMYRKLKDELMEAKVLGQLARLLAAYEDRLVEAESMSRQALAMQKKLLGNDHPDIARSLFSVATLLRRQGKWADAETEYREGVAMWRRLQGKDNFEVESALGYLAEVLMSQQKLQEAEVQRLEQLAMSRRLNGDEHANVVVSLCWLADLLVREGKLDEAEARAREALAIGRKLFAAGGSSVDASAIVYPVDALVSALLAQHKEAEVEQLFGDLLKPTSEPRSLPFGLFYQRSCFFARCHRWQEAVADLNTVLELVPLDDDAAFQLTVLLLETGDKQGYRVQCQKMVATFRNANAPGPLGETAEACLLAPAERDETLTAGQLADQAFELWKNSYLVHDLQLVKGLAEYRAGQFASAIDWVSKSIGQPTLFRGPRPDAAAYLVMAMAQHQLQRPDEARATLAKGADIVDTKLLKRQNATLDENWLDWLVADILLREARALIEGPADTPTSQ
jgi:serine/threonine protein kinase/tetratricopeptide (TPR) repeat protein